MGRPDYFFGQFRETVRCRDVQHGGGVCCAFTPQLVLSVIVGIAMTLFNKLSMAEVYAV